MSFIDNIKEISYINSESSLVGSRLKAVSLFPCGRLAAFFIISKPCTYGMGDVNIVNFYNLRCVFFNCHNCDNISSTTF